ncbi:hypothetical protein Nepgr_022342 [Nepenthes gracilis]|uniref:Pentatricopeptide repeat-containing protein n=1 Tax=Nepenthes gracilis TaxID=150966 RepID=A0AAD3T0N2_NEPGR|nr:hypothetical protein Nepgr_022342 [Nepenthes gracilis]
MPILDSSEDIQVLQTRVQRNNGDSVKQVLVKRNNLPTKDATWEDELTATCSCLNGFHKVIMAFGRAKMWFPVACWSNKVEVSYWLLCLMLGLPAITAQHVKLFAYFDSVPECGKRLRLRSEQLQRLAGFEGDTVLANALIHSYASSMMKVYALHGQASGALELFSKMNVKPDAAPFVALLSACGHAGLVVGANVLDNLSEHYGVVPALDHYACMVNMFRHAGHILEAKNLLS